MSAGHERYIKPCSLNTLLFCVCSNEFKHFQKMTMTPTVEGTTETSTTFFTSPHINQTAICSV